MLFGICPVVFAAVVIFHSAKKGVTKVAQTAEEKIEQKIEEEKEKHYVRGGI